MKILFHAVAGTLESSDAYVQVEPCNTLEIEIESIVYQQFSEHIRKNIEEVLRKFSVTSGKIFVQDQGALDCVIQARVETAVKRAGRLDPI